MLQVNRVAILYHLIKLYNSINITGITDPIAEGTTAMFSCPLGQTLTGPNVSVCMENGEWIPDTEEVQCVKGKFT